MKVTERRAESLGKSLFNPHSWLRQWGPDSPALHFRENVPQQVVLAGPAAVLHKQRLYAENMNDGRWITWNQFRHRAITPEKRWLQRLRLPDTSLIRWQLFAAAE